MALTKLQSQSIDTNITVAGVVTATSFISTSLSVSGVSTLGNVKIGSGSTTLIVDGDARITGILTIGTSSITFDGLNNEISLGTGVTITTSEILIGGNSINSTDLVVENINASGVITATSFVGDGSGLTGAGSTVVDDTSTNQTLYPVLTAQTSGTITSSKVSTTKLSFNPSTGVVSGTGFSGSGASLTSLNATQLTSGIVPSARITETSPLTVNGDLYVAGNISFGGTTTQLNTSQVTFSDPDIVLGVGTTSTFNPTDNTANHGGIAVASTEGYPLVNLNIDAAETLPTTYKKIMWFKNNAAGLGTDAWLSNYAVGIGSTQFSTGIRLAAGNVQFDANDLKVVRNISASGVVTATSFVGDGSGLTGAGSTVVDDTSTNSTFYPLFTSTTTGTVTASKVSTTKLSFNPSTGTLSATKFSGDGSGLTGAGSTVADDTSTNATFYPVLTQTTTGTITESKVSTTKLTFNPSTGRLTATSLGGTLANTLTLSTSGTGLSGSTTFNNSGAATFTVTSNATSANTGSTIVARDASGNFSAGTITATLSGNASGLTGYSGTYWTSNNDGSGSGLDADLLDGINSTGLFNNMGAVHSTRTSFDATTPSYDFGFRYVQGSTNGPGTGGSQFYSWYIGLGSEYAATGAGSYGAMFAVDRNVSTPYLSVRFNEGNSFGSWRRIAAGTADSVTGTTSNGFGTRTIQAGGSAAGGSNGDIYYIY